VTEASPFLSLATRKGLALAIPSSLLALSGGVTWVNQALRAAVGASAALPPSCVERRRVVHGGIVHPGEAPPRSVPDRVALRARVIANAPAFSLLAALGVLDRRGRLRMHASGAMLRVELPGSKPFPFEHLLEHFAANRGWVLVRGPGSAKWGALVDVGVSLGILARPARAAVTLEESFFRKLQGDAEHRDLHEGLQPLADLLEARISRMAGG
jgi:hypothetical protein